MKIKYHISAQSYGTEVNKALKKWYWYLGLLAQFLCIIIWTVDYLISRSTYNSSEIIFINIMTLVLVIFFAIMIHFIFNTWLPKLHNKFIVKKNQRNIGNVILELDSDYIHITSDKNTLTYKRNKVLGVKTLDLTHCIIFSQNIYIVIPKTPEPSDVDKQKYAEDVTAIIKEIERTSKRKGNSK